MAKEKKSTASIVSDYRGVTIGTYCNQILPLARREDVDEVDKQVKIIAILNGLTEQEVLDLPLPTYTEYARATRFLSAPCDTGKAGRIGSKYTIGEWILRPETDWQKLTAAQFIDFQQLSKDLEANTIALLSVFLVPEGHKYNSGYDVAEVRQAIADHLSVQDAMEILGFFFGQLPELLRDSLASLESTAKRLKDKKKRATLLERVEAAKALLRSGAGSPTLTS